jgi:hypothetical protein
MKGYLSGKLGKEKKFYSPSHSLPYIYTKKSFIIMTTGQGGVSNDDDGGNGGDGGDGGDDGGDDFSVGEPKLGVKVIQLDF